MSVLAQIKALDGKKEKRKFLSTLSKQFKPLVESGEFETVNEAIIDLYKNGNELMTFNTFNQWRKEGFQVSKGSKAYPIWGKPVQISNLTEAQKAELSKEEIEQSEREKKFFPVAYIFSNYQLKEVE